MEFDIKKKNISSPEQMASKSELEISYEFAKHIKKEFKDFIRAVVLFGSNVKKTNNPSSDIDILLVIDDVNIVLTPEIVESYRIITEKIVSKVSTKLHITSLKYTTFWDYIRKGDPIGLNILRDGLPILDTGFFNTLKILLMEGRIKPSAESVWIYYSKAPDTLVNSKWHVMQAVLDLYWAVVDSAQALLMSYTIMPPAPEMLSITLSNELVSKGLLEKEMAELVNKFYLLSKKITHNEIKEIPGAQYDELYREAFHFVAIVKQHLLKHVDKTE